MRNETLCARVRALVFGVGLSSPDSSIETIHTVEVRCAVVFNKRFG